MWPKPLEVKVISENGKNGCKQIFGASGAILVCDLELDLVTLNLTFQGHKVKFQKSSLNKPPKE